MEKLVNIKLNAAEDGIIIVDQRALPLDLKYLEIKTQEQAYDAIESLAVRGAPAIGIFAGYSMYVLSKQIIKDAKSSSDVHQKIEKLAEYLNSSRPTAVNLNYVLTRVLKRIKDVDCDKIISVLREEAVKIHEEDKAMCKAISEYGLTLLKDGMGVITHCNAGPLATSEYGTAQGPLIMSKERGLNIRVYADETRPLLQGARLTSFELHNSGVDVTLICDNMASLVMRKGLINIAFVGADRIAANGDFANKIGTSGVAILCKHFGIPFYTFAPSSTIDMSCPTGNDIVIEERSGDEIAEKFYAKRMAPKGIKTFNPAFDVTDHNLLSGIVTEKGIIRAPFDVNLKKMFG